LQVLRAAAACFQKHGFHATSIQRISELAGMSPGHISARLAVMKAIVNGLAIRSLCDPTMNRAATMRVIKQVVRVLLEKETA
jgi:hypothetical protein